MSKDLKALVGTDWEGCARVIYAPEFLIERGFSTESVSASTEIMESNLSDPSQTIYGPDGEAVAQMRGVVLYDLAVRIARQHKLDWVCGWGLQTNLRRIIEAAKESLRRMAAFALAE